MRFKDSSEELPKQVQPPTELLQMTSQWFLLKVFEMYLHLKNWMTTLVAFLKETTESLHVYYMWVTLTHTAHTELSKEKNVWEEKGWNKK